MNKDIPAKIHKSSIDQSCGLHQCRAAQVALQDTILNCHGEKVNSMYIYSAKMRTSNDNGLCGPSRGHNGFVN